MLNGDKYGSIIQKKLWKILVEREMSKVNLCQKVEIAPNTMTKLRESEYVAMLILDKNAKL